MWLPRPALWIWQLGVPKAGESHRRPPSAADRAQRTRRGAAPSGTSLTAEFDVCRPTLREAWRILGVRGARRRTAWHPGARAHMPRADIARRYAAGVLKASSTLLSHIYDARTMIEPPLDAALAEKLAQT